VVGVAIHYLRYGPKEAELKEDDDHGNK
jgi:hypothetical protein